MPKGTPAQPEPKPSGNAGSPAPAPPGEPKAVPDGVADEARAGTYLRLGIALESQRKKAAALDYYRRVLKEYPGTQAAAQASVRIKALGETP